MVTSGMRAPLVKRHCPKAKSHRICRECKEVKNTTGYIAQLRAKHYTDGRYDQEQNPAIEDAADDVRRSFVESVEQQRAAERYPMSLLPFGVRILGEFRRNAEHRGEQYHDGEHDQVDWNVGAGLSRWVEEIMHQHPQHRGTEPDLLTL